MNRFIHFAGQSHVDRRHFLKVGTVSGISSLWAPRCMSQENRKELKTVSLGLVAYCCNLQRQQSRQEGHPDLFQPSNFLRHCRLLGAGGMQIHLSSLDRNKAEKLHQQSHEYDFFIEAIVSLPKTDQDKGRFAQELKTAAAVGANVARTVAFPGRRYERFQSMDDYRAHEKLAREQLSRALPICQSIGVALALENHKDQRIEERVALLKKFDSEWLGACVDTGNSIALLEDPLETAQALAPFAKSVHLKDQAVQLSPDGFLLGDIPLGQGSIDLRSVIKVLKDNNPNLRLSLELITRPPLLVPCLDSSYWHTLRDIPAYQLSKILQWVRDHHTDPLQDPTKLRLDEKAKLEAKNVLQSLAYARDVLNL